MFHLHVISWYLQVILNQHRLPSGWQKCLVLLELICTTVFSHNLSVFPKEVMPFCYIQLYTVVMSHGLRIANNLLWIVSNIYNTWKWQCTHHPASTFSLFLLITQAFYLFLKVLLESSWMMNLLPILCCVSPHSILCWVGMLEFTLNEFWINVLFHLLMP